MDTNRKMLFDGYEYELYSQHFKLDYNGESYLISHDDFRNELHQLQDEMGSEAFANLLDTFKFDGKPGFRSNVTHYFSRHLPVYYTIIGKAILICSLGEFQPGRGMFFYEGVWDLE